MGIQRRRNCAGKERIPYWRVRTGDPNEPGIDGVLLPRDRPGAVTVNAIEVRSIEVFVARIKDNDGKLMEGPVRTPDGAESRCVKILRGTCSISWKAANRPEDGEPPAKKGSGAPETSL